jgi:glutathione S-transferase
LKGRALPGPDDYEQIPALAERGRARLSRFYQWMDARLGASPFVAGTTYSLADITTQIVVEFGKWAKVPVPESCQNLTRWFAEVSARPSAKA